MTRAPGARAQGRPPRWRAERGRSRSSAVTALSRLPSVGVPSQRREREDQPVQVIVDVEVAGEPGPRVLRARSRFRRGAASRPATPRRASPRRRSRSPAASRARRAHAVWDAVLAPRPTHPGVRYERMSSPHPPSGFCWRASQRTAAGLRRPPAGCPPPPPRAPPPRAVHVVGPHRRTTSRRLLVARQPSQPAPRPATPASLRRQHLHHVRGDVRGGRVDDLAEVAEGQRRQRSRVLSASNAPQPPSEDCMPSVQRDAALHRGFEPLAIRVVHAPQRQDHLGGVVDVGIRVVGELEGPAARLEVRPPHPPVPRDADLLAEIQSAARSSAGWSRGKPASARPVTARHVSHTGDWHASSRRRSRSGSTIVNRSSPASAARSTG